MKIFIVLLVLVDTSARGDPLHVKRMEPGLLLVAVRPWIVGNLLKQAILLPYRRLPTRRQRVHVARPATAELHLPSVALALPFGRLPPAVLSSIAALQLHWLVTSLAPEILLIPVLEPYLVPPIMVDLLQVLPVKPVARGLACLAVSTPPVVSQAKLDILLARGHRRKVQPARLYVPPTTEALPRRLPPLVII